MTTHGQDGPAGVTLPAGDGGMETQYRTPQSYGMGLGVDVCIYRQVGALVDLRSL